jgi:hypothetical protein
MATVIGILGLTCVVLALLFFLATWVTLWQLGRNLRNHDAALWDSIKPRFYTTHMALLGAKDRWASFIDGREFESYNDPKLNQLVLAFRLCGIGYWVAFAVAVASIVYVCWWT